LEFGFEYIQQSQIIRKKMPNNFPNQPILEPGLDVRIVDGSDSRTLDQLYFIGTANNYVTKTTKTSIQNVSTFGNFWLKESNVTDNFRDILDGGNSEAGTAQFTGPIIGGEFPTKQSLSNQL
jgi:hypothetical protein